MDSKTRNMLIAGTIGTLCLGPLGAAGVAWAAHHFTPEEQELHATDFSIWSDDQLIGVINPEDISSKLRSLKANEHAFDKATVRIGIRWSDDSAEYMTYQEALNAFL